MSAHGSQGGITFRELMAGGFSMGETDPVCGERAGLQAGTILAMNATVSIPQVERFLRDPDHGGELEATISFPPIGSGIPGTAGQFKLFVRTPGRDCKLMVYSLRLQHPGCDYRLEGSKRVLKRSVVHSWKDTTTLFCRLYDGSGESAKVIGAGVLHLTAWQFLRQLLSFRTLDAASVGGKARSLAGFGLFFARELLDTYFG